MSHPFALGFICGAFSAVALAFASAWVVSKLDEGKRGSYVD